MDYKFGCVIEIEEGLIPNEPYILAKINVREFILVSLFDGNTWFKPQVFNGEVKEKDLIHYLKGYSFNKVADSVENYYRSLL